MSQFITLCCDIPLNQKSGRFPGKRIEIRNRNRECLLAIQTQKTGDVVIIVLSGRFMGMEDNIAFRQVIDDCLNSDSKDIVIDFSNLEWIDSAGIEYIIAMYLKVVKDNGDLLMAGLTERVAYYFEICNLNALF